MKLYTANSATWANIIATAGLLIALIFNYCAIKNQNKTLQATQVIGSAEYVLRLSQELDSSKYNDIESVIYDSKQDTPILSTRKDIVDLYEYIGKLETIASITHSGAIDKNMAYQEFSYDFVKTWCNKDIRNHIEGLRIKDKALSKETTFYHGIEEFANDSMSREHKTCLDYDSN